MNKNINIENYQAFILDYYEGTLNTELQEELFLFLEKNPSLNQEFEEFELIKLEANYETFDNSKMLLKTKEDFYLQDNNIIAFLEGDLNPTESNEFSSFLQSNAELQKKVSEFKRTFIKPESVVYPEKENLLKRDTKVIALRFWHYAAAAILLFAVGVYFIQSPDSNVQIADNTQEPIPIEKDIVLDHQVPTENSIDLLEESSVNREKVKIGQIKQNSTLNNRDTEKVNQHESSADVMEPKNKLESNSQQNPMIVQSAVEYNHVSSIEKSISEEILNDLANLDLSSTTSDENNTSLDNLNAIGNGNIYIEPGSASRKRKRAFKIDVGPIDIAQNDYAISSLSK
ncbi:MAG TPA: hypothetical protein PKH65_09700 [Bacteroidia bacterium]|nr:hypothetical protein [Bacteroidia bacterium]